MRHVSEADPFKELMMGQVEAIYRYPIKGMTAHAMSSVILTAGRPLPFDRAYAIENGTNRFDESRPANLARTNFLMLMRDERLAALECHFDDIDQTLCVFRSGRQVARGDLKTSSGRAIIEQFFAAYMRDELRGAPKIRHAEGHSFSDSDEKCVHLINQATLLDAERAAGRPLDPLRFRPNIIVGGFPAWDELSWLGRDLELGSARLHVFERTERCAATNVDPATAHRDLDIPAMLQRHWGHTSFGVYARVIKGGTVQHGDSVQICKVLLESATSQL